MLFHVIQREWNRITRNRQGRFLILTGPVLSFALAAWLFSSGVPRDLPVALVDQDQTSLSRKVARSADATSIAQIRYSFTGLEEAFNAIREGKAEAVLYIPEGCEKKILTGHQAQPVLWLNNTNVLKSGLLTSGITKATAYLSSGIQAQSAVRQGISPKAAPGYAMPVMQDVHILFNPYLNYAYFLVSSLLPVLLVVFVMMGTPWAIGSELKKGSGPQWLETAGGSISVALAGKLLPYTLFYFLLAQCMNVILFVILGVPFQGRQDILWASQFLLILSYQLMAIFLIGLTSNFRLSLSLAGAYTMMALTFSGLTFPVSAMPTIAKAFAGLFPFTHYLKVFTGQALRAEPVYISLLPLAAMGGLMIPGLCCIPRLRFLLLNESCWYKK